MIRSAYWHAQWIELLSHYGTPSVSSSLGDVIVEMAFPGAPGGTRTHDLAVVSSLLFPTELPGRSRIIRIAQSHQSMTTCH